jgi:hypothetical protein
MLLLDQHEGSVRLKSNMQQSFARYFLARYFLARYFLAR